MRTTVLRDWNLVASLEDEWDLLLSKSGANRLFLSWEWLSSWLQCVQEYIDPYFITVRDSDERLVGVAPFYISKVKFLSLIEYRMLRIAGDHSTGFEYADLIVDADQEDAILQYMGEQLVSGKPDWDIIWIPKVAGWLNSYNRILKAVFSHEHLACNRRDAEFSAIQLPESIKAYDALFTSKRRNQLKRITKKVFKEKSTRFITCNSHDELERFLNALFELHHKRRMLLNDPGTFIRRPSQQQFYLNFAPEALLRGWLRITALESRGEIQAIQMGYVYNNAYLQMQEGFNPVYVNGAGNVLRHHIISQCIDEGLTEYDFLGGFTEHKRRWGAKLRLGHDFIIGNNSLKSRMLIKHNIWPTGRYLLPLDLVN